jgi:DNA-binding transcriptional regulator YhcF (GntR family)
LAGDLGLAVNTVARAYRELEGGSFVARSDPADAAMAAAAESYADTARSLGVDRDRARCYLEAAFDGPSSGSVPNSSSA